MAPDLSPPQAPTYMLDRMGQTVRVGDRVYVRPTTPDIGASGIGYVRAVVFSDWDRGFIARVNNAPKESQGHDFVWSAWVSAKDLELLDAGSGSS